MVNYIRMESFTRFIYVGATYPVSLVLTPTIFCCWTVRMVITVFRRCNMKQKLATDFVPLRNVIPK